MRKPILYYCLYSILTLATETTSVTGVYNSDIILGCSFPITASTDLALLVVTWQWKLSEGTDLVVHSYYYQRDQLDRQAMAYANRTELFPGEFHLGNASLKLKTLQLEDSGHYFCSVSSDTRSTSEDVELLIGALYREPHLTVGIVNCGGEMILKFQTGGGYPEAVVQWLTMEGDDITEHSNTTHSTNGYGLYDVTSQLKWLTSEIINCTFVMKNGRLHQTITRSVTITQEGLQHSDCITSRNRIPAILSFAFIFLIVLIVCRCVMN